MFFPSCKNMCCCSCLYFNYTKYEFVSEKTKNEANMNQLFNMNQLLVISKLMMFFRSFLCLQFVSVDHLVDNGDDGGDDDDDVPLNKQPILYLSNDLCLEKQPLRTTSMNQSKA